MWKIKANKNMVATHLKPRLLHFTSTYFFETGWRRQISQGSIVICCKAANLGPEQLRSIDYKERNIYHVRLCKNIQIEGKRYVKKR